ncbi:heparan-alpha-glucosaminide N-acetyltransferase domain-containing protein [Corynebacterium mastitidis]
MKILSFPSKSLDRYPRLLGLDMARGIAIIGMVMAHTLEVPEKISLTDIHSWEAISVGRPAIMFALISGISVSIATRKYDQKDLNGKNEIKLSLVYRGIFIFSLGLFLEILGSGLSIILSMYGALYLLAICLIGVKSRDIAIYSIITAVFGPVFFAIILHLSPGAEGEGIAFLFQGTYSFIVWSSLMMLGMLIGRIDLHSSRNLVTLFIFGFTISVIGYTIGTIYDSREYLQIKSGEKFGFKGKGAEFYGKDSEIGSDIIGNIQHAFLSARPHSGSTMEIIGSGGFAICIVSACILICFYSRKFFIPLATIGMMPLTSYFIHVTTFTIYQGKGGWSPSFELFFYSIMLILIVSSIFFSIRKKGPLESLCALYIKRSINGK